MQEVFCVISRKRTGLFTKQRNSQFQMVSWGIDENEAQYNGAKMLDIFCVKILKCEYEFDGEKTWFDYGD